MLLKLTTILCTHNPQRKYLKRTLDALAAQTLDKSGWELLIIDNASNPPLSAELDLTWQPNARVIVEPKLGLTAARLCGITAAQADLLVFVDDDNVLDPNYLETALQLSEKWPILGAWGGRILPEFEVTPPEWSKAYFSSLALRDFERDVWSNLGSNLETCPFGAGMCVRRVVAVEYARRVNGDKMRAALGRSGTTLTSGEDLDLASTACDMGLGTGQFVALKLTHLISKSRLEESYLLRLMEGMAYSSTMLLYLRTPESVDGSLLAGKPLRRRVMDFLRRLRMPARDRRFHDVMLRGRKKAILAYAEFSKQSAGRS